MTVIATANAPASETPHRLYRFFGEGGVLLYVGISDDLPTRWTTHRRKKSWWREWREITLTPYPSRQTLEAAEIEAIKTERPLHNIVHNRHRDPVLAKQCMRTDRDIKTIDLVDDQGQWWARKIHVARDEAAHVQLNRDTYVDKLHKPGGISRGFKAAAETCARAGLDRIWAEGLWQDQECDVAPTDRWVNLYVPLALVDAAIEALRSADLSGDLGPLHKLTDTLHAETEALMVTRPSSLVQPGDVVALGLSDGACPVGLVRSVDDRGIRLALYSFLTHYFSAGPRVVLWPQVADILHARERYDSTPEDRVFEMDPLADFQTAWKERHTTV